MINLTPRKLIIFTKDYNYEINKEQSIEILELLDDAFGIYNSQEIIMATDYIVNGEGSRYAPDFQ